jgi:predicted O-methyltransferase YrrM
LYTWYENVLAEDKQYYAFTEIEEIRQKIYADTTPIHRTDYGTGNPKPMRSFGEMAKRMGTSRKKGELLFRIVAQHQPKTLLELGTGTGLSLHYLLHAAGQQAALHTLEGCAETSQRTQYYFQGIKNITFYIGQIQEKLPKILPQLPKLDFVFLDAHHDEKPTLQFTTWLLPKLSENALLVYDDIHWSPSMSRAWQQIVADKRIPLTIDLFDFGLVFLRQKQPKQHFVLH